MTGRVHDMIIDPKQTGQLPEVIAEGAYYGMQTFDQALLEHLQAGRVTMEEALRAATSPHDFKLMVAAQARTAALAPDRAQARSPARPRTPRRSRRPTDASPAAPAPASRPPSGPGGPPVAPPAARRRASGARRPPRAAAAPPAAPAGAVARRRLRRRRPRASRPDRLTRPRPFRKVRARRSPRRKDLPVQTTLAQFNETQSTGRLRAPELQAAEGRA